MKVFVEFLEKGIINKRLMPLSLFSFPKRRARDFSDFQPISLTSKQKKSCEQSL